MNKPFNSSGDYPRMSGIRAGGHSDFLKGSHSAQRIREEKAKLQRRLAKFCKPRGIVGGFLVFRRRRQLIRKLRKRFEVPYALFIGSHCRLSSSSIGGKPENRAEQAADGKTP